MDIFCKIIKKEVPADFIAEGSSWIAIHDLHPKAPIHALLIPKTHISSIDSLEQSHAKLLGELFLAVKTVADKLKLENGYRVIINQGEHGGQVVDHLHLHVLGGKNLGSKIVN